MCQCILPWVVDSSKGPRRKASVQNSLEYPQVNIGFNWGLPVADDEQVEGTVLSQDKKIKTKKKNHCMRHQLWLLQWEPCTSEVDTQITDEKRHAKRVWQYQ